jgi:hypothetical protein
MTMEFREQFMQYVGHISFRKGLDNPLTDIGQLEQVGFSREQIARLQRVKALYQRGLYHEDNLADKRQVFIRWLYRQGRLES